MHIQDYILIAAVAVFCIIGMWNVIAISRKHKASKPKTDNEKTKELMIGDWVRIKTFGISDKFERTEALQNVKIAEIGTGLVTVILGGDLKEPYRICQDTEFEPIPLTAEILKTNGIIKHKFAGHIEECYSLYNNPSDEQFILWEETDRYELVLRHIVDNLTYSALRCKVRNVHELQHALRLCGIDKEIIIKTKED